jgi:hypothetical protein
MATYTEDFESGSLAAWTVTGSPTVSTTQKNSGVYSCYIANTGYSNNSMYFDFTAATDVYVREYFYVTLLPTDGPGSLMHFLTGGGYEVDCRLNTDGTLRLRTNSTDRGSTTTAIALNTWTMVQFRAKVQGASSVCEIKIGTETLSDTTNFATDTIARTYVGDGGNTNAMNFYVDDLALSDSGYPGPLNPPYNMARFQSIVIN